ncbi:MAG: hypothetical protein HY855_03285 [Burkholderiales bacterium]|nr:hypothetical protein [Burkholderiales bacterium]
MFKSCELMHPAAPRRRQVLRRLIGLSGALGLAGLPGLPARAAPRTVEPFDADTWRALRAEVEARRQPMLVAFSATWCGVCPEVLSQLAQDPRRLHSGVPLLVVISDLAPGEADARLLATAHHAQADRVLAFDGNPAAIRHAVDPGWRGVTPYLAWLAPGQAPEFVAGAPPLQHTARWFKPHQPARPSR